MEPKARVSGVLVRHHDRGGSAERGFHSLQAHPAGKGRDIVVRDFGTDSSGR